MSGPLARRVHQPVERTAVEPPVFELETPPADPPKRGSSTLRARLKQPKKHVKERLTFVGKSGSVHYRIPEAINAAMIEARAALDAGDFDKAIEACDRAEAARVSQQKQVRRMARARPNRVGHLMGMDGWLETQTKYEIDQCRKWAQDRFRPGDRYRSPIATGDAEADVDPGIG